jgi:purine-binding chemotaxis protein CheW
MIETATDSSQYITFRLGDELFAAPVAQVHEVLELSHITRIPRSPSHVRGMINHRGQPVPVVDLRCRFGVPPSPETVDTRIVVFETRIHGTTTLVGGLADRVHGVIGLEPRELTPPPRVAMRWRPEFVRAMRRRADEYTVVLDVDAVFAPESGAAAASN